ncbi:hypothetical protein CSC70_10510 [Pseudoxanthomonas kalamensis DSM 18571]|uniref:DUF4242 domain-containing protein n=1 Tax=Pseudoxanthomonas kalamensis TaxID=289483 RepID=UPI00139202BE|nr:DUF4242 domain-containing protein [Pseudoxanthomonas kalamensis]KAF1709248.1 hypothetical protein CSC70_10510 [Pseudoxanthomonas kalamensis DSM 18571]
MKPMYLFLDTHDKASQTFPEGISTADFEAFFAQYEAACTQEGVIPIRIHVGLEAGRAFCLNLAPDAEAVRKAHERVGLPFDSITEVKTASPGDIFFSGSTD